MPPRALLRYPGPLALLRVLEGEAPALHHPEAPQVFLGDDRLWAWPGVREFGALALLDADRLGPIPHPVIDGWYTCAVRPLSRREVLYVPDAECAQCVQPAPNATAARKHLPADYDRRVAAAASAMRAYDEALSRVLATGHPLHQPLHMFPPAERAALLRRLEGAALGR